MLFARSRSATFGSENVAVPSSDTDQRGGRVHRTGRPAQRRTHRLLPDVCRESAQRARQRRRRRDSDGSAGRRQARWTVASRISRRVPFGAPAERRSTVTGSTAAACATWAQPPPPSRRRQPAPRDGRGEQGAHRGRGRPNPDVNCTAATSSNTRASGAWRMSLRAAPSVSMPRTRPAAPDRRPAR